MDREEIIKNIEKETGQRVSWLSECDLYADSEGHVIEDGVVLYQSGVRFFCRARGLDVRFAALDVLYVESALRSQAIEFARGERTRVQRVNPIMAMFKDTVTWLELEQKRMIFLGLKGMQFKQILSVAQAKQKYSLTVAEREK